MTEQYSDGTGEEMHGIEHPADGTLSPEISNGFTRDQILNSLKGLQSHLEDEFDDPRDVERVKQATAALATAAMAIGLLHDTRQNRKDLRAVHDEEAQHGGHYATERKLHPGLYMEQEHSHYETIGERP